MNTTSTSPNTTGSGFWKILAIVVLVIVGLSILWPLVKSLFWIAVVALALYGGYMLLRGKSDSTP